ncbi:hypothetical protein [Psychrobacillus psychrodurans]|uniref:Uncharacterized protein n=1 Tax=Psychrobacillus psychrodurans TaxID=126157 RepID=A0A9X3L9V8_9BACI|nr:hypothetical protein [Psychrobacillus psychrodurans]MCZ8532686.1 hypothetical protein [Psychrobacillus psychrodurans]
MAKEEPTDIILILGVILYSLLFLGLAVFIAFFYATFSILSLSAVLVPLFLFLMFILILWKYSYLKHAQIGRTLLLVFAILSFIPPLFLIGMLGKNEEKLNFTTEKWLNYPDDRRYIVYDFLQENKIAGQTKEDIQKQLGVPEKNSFYSEQNAIEYLLGLELGFIQMDSSYLIIWFDEEDKVIDYEIVSG